MDKSIYIITFLLSLIALIIGSITLSRGAILPKIMDSISPPLNDTYEKILNMEIPLFNQIIVTQALPAINKYLEKTIHNITLDNITLAGNLQLDTLVIESDSFSQTSAAVTSADCMSLKLGGKCIVTFSGHYDAVITCKAGNALKACSSISSLNSSNFNIGVSLKLSGSGSVGITAIGTMQSNYNNFKIAVDNSMIPACIIKPEIGAWGETLGTLLAPGEICGSNDQCVNTSCGFLGGPTDNNMRCCPSGQTVNTGPLSGRAGGNDFCTDQPNGNSCFGSAGPNNPVCASGWCETEFGTCFQPEESASPCNTDYECASGACGKLNAFLTPLEAGYECCPSGKTHLYYGRSFCTDQPLGNKCRGTGSEICASGCCDSSDHCAPKSACSSCFTSETLITMADGLKKPISAIKKGEEVLSAKSFKPVKVLVIDDMNKLGNRKLIGFNGLKPFVTEDHCFINPIDFDNRLTFNLDKSLKAKHWKNVGEIKEGIKLVNENSIREVEDIIRIVRDKDLRVYDLITEDHSYIANGYGVYDDFPEIEKSQFKSLVILEICKILQDREFDNREKIYKLLPEFFYNNVNHAINKVKKINITPELFRERFEEFIDLVNKKKQILYLGAALWKKYLPKINNPNSKIKPLPKIIQV
ncbi:hypothetical protein OAK19_00170 [Aureispira]|nr:hypothetical protein [Aureispira sp.]